MEERLTFQKLISVTPTLIHFAPSNFIQSNKILRKYSQFKTDFVRVRFESDMLKKDYYYGDINLLKLPPIFKIIRDGLNLPNLKLRAFCYSNS